MRTTSDEGVRPGVHGLHQRAGGPTTEAGRQRKADAEAAKAEKEARRRAKNKKKNLARRAKKNAPDEPTRNRWWFSGGKAPKGWAKFAERQAEEQKQQEKSRRRHKRQQKSCCGDSDDARSQAPPAQTAGASWEHQVEEARVRGDAQHLAGLFKQDLERTGVAAERARQDGGKAVTKRFRILSLKFHPDKHAGLGSGPVALYTTAFRALVEAHAAAKDGFF